MSRFPVWFNKKETEKIKKKCQDCGLAPYSWIKDLVLKELEKDVRNDERRLDEVERKNGEATRGVEQTETGLPY